MIISKAHLKNNVYIYISFYFFNFEFKVFSQDSEIPICNGEKLSSEVKRIYHGTLQLGAEIQLVLFALSP